MGVDERAGMCCVGLVLVSCEGIFGSLIRFLVSEGVCAGVGRKS